MKYAVIALIVLVCASSSAVADTYPRQPGVDAWHYVFRRALSDESAEISGDATVDLVLTRDDVREVALDLTSASDNKGMTVGAVTIGGQPVRFVHRDNRLTLTLPSPPR